MKEYFKHPLIKNPALWVEGKKFHTSELEIKGNYDRELLKSNPFALPFTDTKMDGGRTRFPRGQLIQIVVDRKKQLNEIGEKKKSYFLVPLLGQLNKKIDIFTSHYIIANQKYVQCNMKDSNWTKFIPNKFKHRNQDFLISQLNVLPKFADYILEALQEKVQKSLYTGDFRDKSSDSYYHIVLDFKSTSNVKCIYGEKYMQINMRLLGNFKFNGGDLLKLSLENNEMLISDLMLLMDYKS